MGKAWTDTNAPKTGGAGEIERLQLKDLTPGSSWRIRLFGDVLPNMVYWVTTKEGGKRTRPVCNFNRETEEFDPNIDDPIGRIVGPRVKDLRPTFAYVTKCIFRTPEGQPDKIMIFDLKQTIYNAIAELARNPEWGDPADPENGYDLTIEKKKTGPLPQNVKYVVTPSRRATPFTEKEKEMIANHTISLEKLYKQETPEEQIKWLKENTNYLEDDSESIESAFDPNDDVPF